MADSKQSAADAQAAQQREADRAMKARDTRIARERDAVAESDQGIVADAEPVFEVMVDTFGSNPTYVRGDLLAKSEVPGHYDLDWAVRMGSLRPAPEYVGRGLASTTMPVEGQPQSVEMPPMDEAR